MTISGWNTRYREILREFNYNKRKDYESALLLNFILDNPISLKKIQKIISRNVVFVIGAGPSLLSSIPILKKYKKIPKIVADSAIEALVENKIKPNIIVTDLDGNEKYLKKIGKSDAIFVIHAHGDNISKLYLVKKFRNCIGTTQGKPFGKIQNFGGFTDGDRCVFVASHFKAKKIILFGMDFGKKIGPYSRTKIEDKQIKIKKLNRGKKLLEGWADKKSSNLFTTSYPLRGFRKITFKELEDIIIA